MTVYEAYKAFTLSGATSEKKTIGASRPARTLTWNIPWAVTGGTGAFGVKWTKIAGAANTSIAAGSSDTSLTPTLTATGFAVGGKQRASDLFSDDTDVWRCQISDGRTSMARDYSVTISRQEVELDDVPVL